MWSVFRVGSRGRIDHYGGFLALKLIDCPHDRTRHAVCNRRDLGVVGRDDQYIL